LGRRRGQQETGWRAGKKRRKGHTTVHGDRAREVKPGNHHHKAAKRVFTREKKILPRGGGCTRESHKRAGTHTEGSWWGVRTMKKPEKSDGSVNKRKSKRRANILKMSGRARRRKTPG